MTTFLTLQPLIFGRWDLMLGYGADERGYYTRFDMMGEWLITGEDMALIFDMPFIHNGLEFSLTDTKFGAKVRFLETGYVNFNLIFPTGRFSSRNPAGEVLFGRYIKRDTSFGLFFIAGGSFTAASDTNEYAYYNKISYRRAYRHMNVELLAYKGIGETMGTGISIVGDYAYSLNSFWTSIKVGYYIAPFVEFGGQFWLYKPRPEVFRVYILGNFFI